MATDATSQTAAIHASIEETLRSTPYAASNLRPLSGGNANFIYHATLQTPLPDGTADVVVKHGEGFVASSPDWKLGKFRCEIEKESLRLVEQLPPLITPHCEVRTPRMLFFNPDNCTQIQEYLPHALSLKDYARKHWPAPSPVSVKPRCIELGRSLGQWLRSFHNWSEQPANSQVRELFSKNKEMQAIKKMVNYDQLLRMVNKWPSFLKESEGVFQEVAKMAADELEDESKLHVIHGDFWTGNILLPDESIDNDKQIPVRIVDWEMAQLGVRPEDLGQVIAELWELKLYKDIDAGLWIIEGFGQGYGTVENDFMFRALVHTGAHLVAMGSTTPGWGTPEQGEQVARTGKDLLVNAFRKDRKAFEGHDLERLLR